jgi:hypothetical protein
MAQTQDAVGKLKEILDIGKGGDIARQMGCQTRPETTQYGNPCGWTFNPDRDESTSADLANWDRRRPAEVERLLRELSQMTLGDLATSRTQREKLRPLAQWGLCYHHNKYAQELVVKWVGNIEREQEAQRAQEEQQLRATEQRARQAQLPQASKERPELKVTRVQDAGELGARRWRWCCW